MVITCIICTCDATAAFLLVLASCLFLPFACLSNGFHGLVGSVTLRS